MCDLHREEHRDRIRACALLYSLHQQTVGEHVETMSPRGTSRELENHRHCQQGCGELKRFNQSRDVVN
uniref:Uncharacterized protein n=1 Tax=Triticum urartu TaxID=4572 RepID=A0A8R7R3H8_TRIUA